ncbi:MAG TPA: YbaB/EbfC family nucleoid-associated protein [Acidimicrobiales bacterium]
MTDTGDTGDKGDTRDQGEQPELHGGEMGDLGGLLEQAQQALSAHAQAAEQVVTGTAGGGVVTVEMSGAGEVRSVTLAPEVVDPADIDMLQDLIVAALHDAAHQVTELQRKALGSLGGLGDMLGGMTGRPAPDEG